jgi:integrase
MNATSLNQMAENVIPLAIHKPKPLDRKQRFKIIEFRNPSGGVSFRVSGCDRNGKQIRENFKDEAAAQCRQIELQLEYLKEPTESAIRATKLSEDQLRLAEHVMQRLGEDWPRLMDAVEHWTRTGAKSLPSESPRIDEAVDQYLAWLAASDLRDATKRHWKIRMNVFKNSVPNARVAEVTPDAIWAFLDTRKTTAGGKDTDRRAVSRFFSWCIERPRRWANSNPCHGVKVKQAQKSPPSILSLADCKAILGAAEAHKGGILAPYVAVCLFGGLRPAEAARLDWQQVNLKDGEILLGQDQTKTKKSRVIKLCPTLAAWLKAHKGKPFYPANWRKEFDAVKGAAGLKEWPSDVMRHTAISHYFRKSGSYGFTAEQFGNSESIIKNHYQGRVSSEDTKAFYKIMPGNVLPVKETQNGKVSL